MVAVQRDLGRLIGRKLLGVKEPKLVLDEGSRTARGAKAHFFVER